MRISIVFVVLMVLLVCFAGAIRGADSPTTMPATMPTTAPSNITWDQAKNFVGQTVTVTGPVVGTHDFGDAAVLNVGYDFPNPDRFTVFIPAEKRTGMPKDLDNGKTIRVSGAIKMYRNVPEIEADFDHISIEQTSTRPATQP
jgi:hypothetical protein